MIAATMGLLQQLQQQQQQLVYASIDPETGNNIDDEEEAEIEAEEEGEGKTVAQQHELAILN